MDLSAADNPVTRASAAPTLNLFTEANLIKRQLPVGALGTVRVRSRHGRSVSRAVELPASKSEPAIANPASALRRARSGDGPGLITESRRA
ncbi:hypothetical protein Vqi01_50370 [Micromonospora qiuiae]|uniref:Uncharacterized protein n=1 Tax=Micromonospora qiuiae TaxID=502268 RepID=A0ABQ4JGW7_9ACTN|nr:hypothetical protein Vqi01_50370 [Micromonospora qiuiae]